MGYFKRWTLATNSQQTTPPTCHSSPHFLLSFRSRVQQHRPLVHKLPQGRDRPWGMDRVERTVHSLCVKARGLQPRHCLYRYACCTLVCHLASSYPASSLPAYFLSSLAHYRLTPKELKLMFLVLGALGPTVHSLCVWARGF